MGLDMNLSKRTYIKNWDHQKAKEKHKITIKGPHAKTINPERITYITEEVAYWRKANQIHQWFVDNIQGGNDDCKEYFVSKEQLEELLSLISDVIKSPAKAKKLLPVQPGFFFGTKGDNPESNEEYDEFYYKDLVETQKTLEKLLKEPDTGDFYYQSSW